MTDLCFIDTETTSLRHDRRAWEIGIIKRGEDGTETERQWFISCDDLDLGIADLMSLKIGRFHERHPGWGIWENCAPESIVLSEVERITRGAHLVGAVVSFDAEVLAARMTAHDICPSWHYHLIDVEALAVGYIAGLRKTLKISIDDVEFTGQPPWKSDDLSAALGITVSDEDRHTALGDARWARSLYDAVMGGAS